METPATFVGVAGGLVLLSALSVMLLHDPSGDRLLPTTAPAWVAASAEDVASPIDPMTAAVSPTPVPALPVPSPSAAVTVVPDLAENLEPSAAPVVSTRAPAQTVQQPVRSAAPSPAPTGQFQGLHGPLPTHCIAVGYSCQYTDSTDTTPGGVINFDAVTAGPTSVTVSWTVGPPTPAWPTPVGLVLRIYADGRLVRDVRLENSPASTVLTELPSGPKLSFHMQELNSGGLSSAVWLRVLTLGDFTVPSRSPDLAGPPPA